MSSFNERHKFYTDGITRVTDPFWKLTCKKCGELFMSCICIAKCPRCGSVENSGMLGDKTKEEVIAERGEPKNPGFLDG